MKNEGLSTIINCVMIDNSGRIKDSNFESLIRLMNSLGYFDYKDNIYHLPKICLLFTNCSKFVYNSEEEDEGDGGLPCGDDDDNDNDQENEINDH